MNEMHEFIFKQGFLILLIVFWFVWFMMLERRGLANKNAKPAPFGSFTSIAISECENHCPRPLSLPSSFVHYWLYGLPMKSQ